MSVESSQANTLVLVLLQFEIGCAIWACQPHFTHSRSLAD